MHLQLLSDHHHFIIITIIIIIIITSSSSSSSSPSSSSSSLHHHHHHQVPPGVLSFPPSVEALQLVSVTFFSRGRTTRAAELRLHVTESPDRCHRLKAVRRFVRRVRSVFQLRHRKETARPEGLKLSRWS